MFLFKRIQCRNVNSIRFSRKLSIPRKDSGNDVNLSTGLGIGIFSGVLGSLCGVGGSLVIVPALKQFTNLTIHRITGTSLAAVTVGSLFGSFSYISQGIADIGIASLLGFSAIFSSKLGVSVGLKLSKKTLQRILAAFMLCNVPSLVRERIPEANTKGILIPNAEASSTKRQWQFYLGRRAPTVETFPQWLKDNYQYCFVGVFTGFSTALLGVGGGIIMTGVLGAFSPLTQHEAVATSLVAMVPVGLSSAIWHFKAHNVRLRSAGIIGGGSAVMMLAGATYIAPKVDESVLRRIFAVLLSLSAIQMLR